MLEIGFNKSAFYYTMGAKKLRNPPMLLASLKKRVLLWIPLFIFLILFFFFLNGLKQDPHLLPSPWIHHQVPAFSLPTLKNPRIKLHENIFKGHPTLLNVFASWCPTCQEEQAFLFSLKKSAPTVSLVGLNYKDAPDAVQHWLQQWGNPYDIILEDTTGQTAIDYGVYGTPESFLIDSEGIIIAKHVGVLDETAWKKMLQTISHVKPGNLNEETSRKRPS